MAPPSTDLSTMNKNTVRFTTWVGRVAYGHSYSYTYDSKKTQQRITSYKLECRVVGKSEKDYVQAVLKGTATEVESAKKKYADGSAWVLSNVKFEENANPALISTPLKVSVDLKKSTLNVNVNADIEKELAQLPVPPRTVAETSQITTTRHQDLLALVTKVATLGHRNAAKSWTSRSWMDLQMQTDCTLKFRLLCGERKSKTWSCST